VTATTILFCLAELWPHVTVLYKIGAHCVCRMSGLFSPAVVTGHQHTRYDKAFQICPHALIVVEELMEICASASSRPGLWLISRTPLAGHMSGLTGAWILYITMPVCAMSTSIAPVLQSAKPTMLHRQ